MHEGLQEKINTLSSELEKMAPNLRAIERLEGVESRLKGVEEEYEEARQGAKRAMDEYVEVRDKRSDLFNTAFEHIQKQVKVVYGELTKIAGSDAMGQAYVLGLSARVSEHD